MMTAKSATERMEALRKRRKADGLKRYDVYVHPDDWPLIRQLAKKLQDERRKIKRGEGDE